MDLTEAEDIKKRWQEYTGEMYKKDPHNPDNHDGVITYLPCSRRDSQGSFSAPQLESINSLARRRFYGPTHICT